eukprot:gene16107-biopygen482
MTVERLTYLRFIIKGTLGPVMSASRIPTERFMDFKANARFTATVDLPTPPLAEDTAMILLTPCSPTRLANSPAVRVTGPAMDPSVIKQGQCFLVALRLMLRD